MELELIITNVVIVIGAIADYIRRTRKRPVQEAYEEALAQAILSRVLEQTTEALAQPELSQRFREVARTATGNDAANAQLAGLSDEKIWFIASQISVRGQRVTLHDGAVVEAMVN